jgi:hypothetical protein
MPRRKVPAHELKTDEAIRKMFPPEVREAAKREALKARKPLVRPSIAKKDS